jgi:hypothetical protein
MTIITHTVVGIALSRFFPSEYLPASIAFSLLPDLDHVPHVRKWRLRIHGFETSQTAMHGVLGAAVYGTIGLLTTIIDHEIGTLFLICVATHLFLDFISGVSVPFKHIAKSATRTNFGNLPGRPAHKLLGRKLWIRLLQETSVIAVSLLIFMH